MCVLCERARESTRASEGASERERICTRGAIEIISNSLLAFFVEGKEGFTKVAVDYVLDWKV